MWPLVYMAILFAVLTPGVVLALPPGQSLVVQAATHGVVFALVWSFTHRIVGA